uniref:hypothetical protein n=1 Tax=Ekhidna sp. TaxID=2608089 RepID=UPI0032EFECD6
MKENKKTITMLQYCKLLLHKVSFSDELVKKEYKKGIRFLNHKDQKELKKWLHFKGIMVE